MKKLLLCMATGLVLGLGWNALYNYVLSPDFRFWNRCAAAAEAWNAKLRQESASPCYVFGGGSETRTSIDPAYAAKQYGLRIVNGAGQGLYGGACNAAYAVSYLRAGDTLVFPLTAYDMTEAPRPGGLRFLFRRRGLDMFQEVSLSRDTLHALLGGDAISFSGTLAKILTTGNPDFRYEHDAVVEPSGWMRVTATDEQMNRVRRWRTERLSGLNPAALGAYLRLQEQCQRKGGRLLFRLHLMHTDESARAREAMAALSAVRAGLCVLRDPRLGCSSDPRDFADTDNHLSPEGVKRQMDYLCPALKNRRYWTEEELVRELRWLGWADDGTPLMSAGSRLPW